MASDTDDRDARLGRMLAAMVEAPRTARPRRGRLAAVVGAALAIAVAGGATGALTAGAIVTGSERESTMRAVAVADSEGGVPKGTAVFAETSGTAVLALGTPPRGATGLLVAAWCLAPGTVEWSIGDGSGSSADVGGSAECTEDGPDYPRTSVLRGADGGPSILTARSIRVTGPAYAIWASWYRAAPISPPSAAQREALADGVVTRQEYVAGYSRMVGCMSAEAGVDLAAPTEAPEISSAVPAEHIAVFDTVCYPREFERVDMAWQLALDDRIAACFASHGLTDGGGDRLARLVQLRAAGIRYEDCGLLG